LTIFEHMVHTACGTQSRGHKVEAADHADPAGANARSVRVELQADCFAGLWAHSAYQRGELTRDDFAEALQAAAVVGDDFLQRNAAGTVNPGDQVVFARTRVTGTGLCPNTAYTVTYPYGTLNLHSNALGTLQRNESTVDLGCIGAPCIFNSPTLLSAPMFNSFLQWDPAVAPAAPAGYLGDNVNPHKVVGGTNGNSFSIADAATGDVVGSTRFLTLRPEHRGLEIGYTWLARAAWGTGANVEAKLLMLEHAFERLGCARVEFKTDERNWRSRRALEALGARFEGVFRKHMLLQDGTWRDSAYYSVIDDEWPAVKTALQQRLEPSARRRGGSDPD
jgi:hypothetical protein